MKIAGRRTTEQIAIPRRELAPAWQAWVETAALFAVIAAVGMLVDRSDPFLLRRPFPWLTLAPLLAGLQHGSARGMSCAAGQALVLLATAKLRLVAVPDSLPEVALGWLCSGLLAGEFRDAWLRRTRQLETCAGRVRAKLQTLERAYVVLTASHDRLQQGAPGRPSTLRDVLDAFRRELEGAAHGRSAQWIAEHVLALLSEHAFVRSATFHPVDRQGKPAAAIAALGSGVDAASDPLVMEAARHGTTMSVRDAEDTAVLAAVPLVDVEGRVHAVVAIRDVPFVAFNVETLELLAAVGGHLGDFLAHAEDLVRSQRAVRTVRARAALPSDGLEVAPAPIGDAA
ncbi:MAG TPA: GAF domain-containing protein [Myxococcales bacterium]|jgi:hypothetical protein|nr:GAF domain-containing protein [Myxococcales bacterium]